MGCRGPGYRDEGLRASSHPAQLRVGMPRWCAEPRCRAAPGCPQTGLSPRQHWAGEGAAGCWKRGAGNGASPRFWARKAGTRSVKHPPSEAQSLGGGQDGAAGGTEPGDPLQNLRDGETEAGSGAHRGRRGAHLEGRRAGPRARQSSSTVPDISARKEPVPGGGGSGGGGGGAPPVPAAPRSSPAASRPAPRSAPPGRQGKVGHLFGEGRRGSVQGPSSTLGGPCPPPEGRAAA